MRISLTTAVVVGCLLYLGILEVYDMYLTPLTDAFTGLGE